MREPAKVLREALTLLEERGWWNAQNLRNIDNSHCAYLAIAILSTRGDRRPCQIFEEANGIEAYKIADWNDAEGLTFDDVKAAFARAITLAEGEGW